MVGIHVENALVRARARARTVERETRTSLGKTGAIFTAQPVRRTNQI